jgi:hypothetical protein
VTAENGLHRRLDVPGQRQCGGHIVCRPRRDISERGGDAARMRPEATPLSVPSPPTQTTRSYSPARAASVSVCRTSRYKR